MTTELEGTTMEYIAEWLYDRLEAEMEWEELSDSTRFRYRRMAVEIIDLAEPVWRRRVSETPRAEDVWDEAVSACIAHTRMGVESEPEELAGYIDQHWALIGMAKLENPYAKSV